MNDYNLPCITAIFLGLFIFITYQGHEYFIELIKR